jgi:hypothetical protein
MQGPSQTPLQRQQQLLQQNSLQLSLLLHLQVLSPLLLLLLLLLYLSRGQRPNVTPRGLLLLLLPGLRHRLLLLLLLQRHHRCHMADCCAAVPHLGLLPHVHSCLLLLLLDRAAPVWVLWQAGTSAPCCAAHQRRAA